MLLASALLTALVVLSTTTRAAQIPLSKINEYSSALDDAFERWLSELLSEWGGKGLAIAVVKQGKGGEWTIENKGYGIKDSDGNPVTENTLFPINSNSKLFASLAIGKLIESKQYNIDWTSKIADLLPEWRLQDLAAEKHANLLDILSHRTGLPGHDFARKVGQSPEDAVFSLRHLRPSAKFRETWQYNNFMYMTAALIVERLTGVPYIKFVNDYIISPLGLNSTTFNETAAELTGDLAQGFSLLKTNVSNGDGWSNSVHRATPLYLTPEGRPLIAGPGGIISSAKDIATWLQTLLLEGRHPRTNATVIPAAAIRQAGTGVSVMNGRAAYPELSPQVYGAGQVIYTYQGHQVVEHTGGWSGWKSVIARLPNDSLGVAVLTNWDQGGYLMDVIKFHLIEKVLGLETVDWDSRTRATVRAAMETENDITAPDPNRPSRLKISQIAGTYRNPAYGQIELCESGEASEHLSNRCAGLVARYHQQLRRDGRRTYSPLIAHIPSVVANHAELTHFALDTFNVTFGYFVPKSAFSNKDKGGFIVPLRQPGPTAEFVLHSTSSLVAGFAFNGIWGAGPGILSPSGQTVKGRAEVWFDRIESIVSQG